MISGSLHSHTPIGIKINLTAFAPVTAPTAALPVRLKSYLPRVSLTIPVLFVEFQGFHDIVTCFLIRNA